MAKMANSLRDWQSERFEQSFKTEMEGFRKDVLPLNEVIGEGNTAYDGDLGAMINGVSEDERFIRVRAGLFFAEIVSCCSCGEGDPIEEAYCELEVTIDKSDAEATFTVIKD